MVMNLSTAHRSLWQWCCKQNFAGYDPYDALNSRPFQSTPLKHSRISRLAWTQIFKRLPFNLRPLALVPAERNPKGLALFALAALADFRRLRTKEAESEARALVDDLLAARLTSKSGAICWGYNFDWQSRALFVPRGTPTIVPTAFAARALVEAGRAFGVREYLQIARSVCDFVLRDLHRSDETKDEACFSYSPVDHTRIFNASLLAAETLSSVAALTNEGELHDWATRAARYVVRRQNADGSWPYGAKDYQSWSDNFHTAFVLTSLSRLIHRDAFDRNQLGAGASCANEARRTRRLDEEFAPQAETALRRGYEFWRERFFLENGWPKYFPNRLYPADAHAAGASIVALAELQWLDTRALELAETIARWTIENLRDRRGFFYYQRRRFFTVRIPYMRWSQAWMLYGLARLLECKG